MEAQIMKSFGGLTFGVTTTEAELFFGPPEETEKLEAIDGSVSLVWHYWRKGFTLFFDQDDGGRFTCVEVDNTVKLSLWDRPVFELNEAQLKKLFLAKGFSVVDEERQEWGEKRISFDDAMVDFYFENDKIVSINFGVVMADMLVIYPN